MPSEKWNCSRNHPAKRDRGLCCACALSQAQLPSQGISVRSDSHQGGRVMGTVRRKVLLS